jgi:hypothetical protein
MMLHVENKEGESERKKKRKDGFFANISVYI